MFITFTEMNHEKKKENSGGIGNKENIDGLNYSN